jgi:DNA-binding response OmpR family regulator
MIQSTIRTIIVDDEPLARRRLHALLAGHADMELVAECGDGREALALITRERPDLVFLDVQMAELDGLSVAMAIAGPKAPAVVLVTAFDEYAVEAFRLRALDYLLKPFDESRFLETLARVREHAAAMRQRAVHERLVEIVGELEDASAEVRRRRAVIRVADLEIDRSARVVRRAGVPRALRRKEFDLLVALARRAGDVVTRRELLAEVWGYQADVVSRTLDTHLAELRRKLGHQPGEPAYIHTLAGTGYRMSEPEGSLHHGSRSA